MDLSGLPIIPGGFMPEKFSLILTAGVSIEISENDEFSQFVLDSLRRHIKCDWGDVTENDAAANNTALQIGERVLSAYNDDRFPKHGVATIWIITEADRSVTTILFPDEY